MAHNYAFLCLSLLAQIICYVDGHEQNISDIYTVWSKSYPSTTLNPYDWSYLRVELPPRFSSLTIILDTDIDLDPKSITKRNAHRLPTMCFRQGAPSLPDFSQASLENFVLEDVYDQTKLRTLTTEKCFAVERNLTLKLSNEQIAEGVLFISLFNGIGPARTQSRMINRGKSYTFRADASVDACNRTIFWGQFCNKTLHRLTCVPMKNHGDETQSNQIIGGREVACINHLRSCHSIGITPKLVFLNVENMSEELTFSVYDIELDDQSISTDIKGNVTISLIIYARNGAIPTTSLFDYSTDISRNQQLIIKLPKLGTWYFYIVPVIHIGTLSGITQQKQLCYSLKWKVLEYTIQGNDQEIPIINVDGTKLSSIHFPLRKTSQEEGLLGYQWTYFLMKIPANASDRNIRIEIVSNTSIDYEFYARFGGLPSLDMYDYYYANQTSNSNNGLSLFKVYVSSNQRVKLDIINAQEGNWTLGFIRRQYPSTNLESQTNLTISLESCPDNCSGFGECHENSALTSCSFCRCDIFHGGFDCSIELVKKSEQKLHIAFLVGSNAIAIFPAICALWKKSYAEWVVFLSSGLSSAIYHACDTQWICAIQYDILQFMDFWLSFVAVISTFLFMVSISEAMKRAILSTVWILTALMAIHDATSSKNINFVIIIGAACLFIAWLVESLTNCREFSTLSLRHKITCSWFLTNLKKICRHFRWGYLIAGFAALALAKTSWDRENSENYWIWHSTWHITIYAAAFFFLCSKVNVRSEVTKSDGNNNIAVVPTTSTQSNDP